MPRTSTAIRSSTRELGRDSYRSPSSIPETALDYVYRYTACRPRTRGARHSLVIAPRAASAFIADGFGLYRGVSATSRPPPFFFFFFAPHSPYRAQNTRNIDAVNRARFPHVLPTRSGLRVPLVLLAPLLPCADRGLEGRDVPHCLHRKWLRPLSRTASAYTADFPQRRVPSPAPHSFLPRTVRPQ